MEFKILNFKFINLGDDVGELGRHGSLGVLGLEVLLVGLRVGHLRLQ